MSMEDAIALCGPLRHVRYVAGVARRMARSSVPGSHECTEWQKTRRNYIGNYLTLRSCREGVRA